MRDNRYLRLAPSAPRGTEDAKRNCCGDFRLGDGSVRNTDALNLGKENRDLLGVPSPRDPAQPGSGQATPAMAATHSTTCSTTARGGLPGTQKPPAPVWAKGLSIA
jgi:hypothetical protein